MVLNVIRTDRARYEKERGGDGRARSIAAALAPWLNPGEPVVDVGVGTGIIAKTLVEEGIRVIGIEISLGMLSEADNRLPGLVVLAESQNRFLWVVDPSTPITFVWSLHHIGRSVNALQVGTPWDFGSMVTSWSCWRPRNIRRCSGVIQAAGLIVLVSFHRLDRADSGSARFTAQQEPRSRSTVERSAS